MEEPTQEINCTYVSKSLLVQMNTVHLFIHKEMQFP